MSPRSPHVRGLFDKSTSTLSYLVADPATQAAAIIDPVLDFDSKAARTSTAAADRMIEVAAGLKIEWILETHTHADHLSAAPYLKARLGGRIAIGAYVAEVQKAWKRLLNLDPDFRADGSQFDHLFGEGDHFQIGSLDVTVLHTPGHTPACISYIVRGSDGPACAFVGDTLFMPDYGTARTDFPGGDARQLYRSIQRILSLPPDTRIFVCHDYQPGGRALAYEATVAEHRRANLHIKDGTTEDAFAEFRQARDKTLDMPALLLPSVQVNIRAGRLPPAESNGTAYLKIPLNRF